MILAQPPISVEGAGSLTTTGCQTGQVCTCSSMWVTDGPSPWRMELAAAAHSRCRPGTDLLAHPDDIWIHLGPRRLPVRVEEPRKDAPRERLQRLPMLSDYPDATRRLVPILRLTPA